VRTSDDGFREFVEPEEDADGGAWAAGAPLSGGKQPGKRRLREAWESKVMCVVRRPSFLTLE